MVRAAVAAAAADQAVLAEEGLDSEYYKDNVEEGADPIDLVPGERSRCCRGGEEGPGKFRRERDELRERSHGDR